MADVSSGNNDVYTSTVTHSYGSRLGGSLKGILGGIVIGVVGIGLLIWNEGNYVRQYKALEEGKKLLIEVPSIDTIDSKNENKLIHIIGMAETNNDISDTYFGVTIPGALKLRRNVEMYQWVENKETETHKKTGGSTEEITKYTYEKKWRSDVINSNSFAQPSGHENPNDIPYSENEFIASPITVGAYTLSNDIINKIYWYQSIPNTLTIDNIPDENLRNHAITLGNGYYFATTDSGSTQQRTNNVVSDPQIGDVRVLFEYIPEQIISIIARQVSNSLSTYYAKSGGSFLLVESGPHNADEMFAHAQSSLSYQTWLFRALGYIAIFIMFKAISQPIQVAVDVLPCLGNLVGTASDVITFLLAAVIATIVIAIAWLAYRPIFSLSLLGIAAVLFFIVTRQRRGGGQDYYHPPSNDEYIPTATVISNEGENPPSYNPNYKDIPEAVPITKF